MIFYQISIALLTLIIARGNGAMTPADKTTLELFLSTFNMTSAINFISKLPGTSLDRQPGYERIFNACDMEEVMDDVLCSLYLDYAIKNENFEQSDLKSKTKNRINLLLKWVTNNHREVLNQFIEFLQVNPDIAIINLSAILEGIYKNDFGNFYQIIEFFDKISIIPEITVLPFPQRQLRIQSVNRIEVVAYGKLIDLLNAKKDMTHTFVMTIVVRLKYLHNLSIYSRNPSDCSCGAELLETLSKLHPNLKDFIQSEYVFINFEKKNRILQLDPDNNYKIRCIDPSNPSFLKNPNWGFDHKNTYHKSRWFFKPNSHRNRTFYIFNAHFPNYLMYSDYSEVLCKNKSLRSDNDVFWKPSEQYIPEALWEITPGNDKKFEYFVIQHVQSGQYIWTELQEGLGWSLFDRIKVFTRRDYQRDTEKMWTLSMHLFVKNYRSNWSNKEKKVKVFRYYYRSVSLFENYHY